MKTLHFLPLVARCLTPRNLPISILAMLAAALPLTASPAHDPVPAERHSQLSTLSGMYKIVTATDPMFPGHDSQEWFLDFGKGMTTGKLSGTVAVSMRQNPNVRVRILVWQMLPAEGTLRIGNQTAQGSGQAVLRGEWRMSRAHSGLVLQRGDFHALLRPAGPTD